MLLSHPVRTVVVVDTAIRSALNDVVALSRAELSGEHFLEYCIHRYFSSNVVAPIEQALGYSGESGYLSDAERETYQNDLLYLYQCIDNLIELLHPHLNCLVELGGTLTDVKVVGVVATLKFI